MTAGPTDMTSEFRDTVPTWEATRYEHTQVDDVFLPSVRVQLGWKDIEAAVEQGAILPSEAHTLWANWASACSPLRVAAKATVHLSLEDDADAVSDIAPPTGHGTPMDWRNTRPVKGFSVTNAVFVVGGVATLGALAFLMTQGWDALGTWGLMVTTACGLLCCVKVATSVKRRA